MQAPAQYGAGVLDLASLLNTGYLLPFKKIPGIFADIFGYAVNEGTRVRANTLAYAAFASSEALLKVQ